MLLCESLQANTSGEEIFKCVNNYFEKHDIPWTKCVDICIDGATAMVRKLTGVVTRIKGVSPNCTSSHCVLHREALATKKLSVPLKTVLDETVKIVNYIKSQPLQTRLFSILCDEMCSQYTSLLLHTDVRWLSRGKVLTRVFELRNELVVFLLDKKFTLSDQLTDLLWLQRLAYLADIFSKLNEINLSLQGRDVTVFAAKDKMLAALRKVSFWISCMEKGEVICFPTLSEFLNETECELDDSIREDISDYLHELVDNFVKYFPATTEENQWIQNPFNISTRPVSLSVPEYENLIELTSDGYMKAKLADLSLINFWNDISDDQHSVLKKHAQRILMPFVTTYLCETAFSHYIMVKTKYRNRLDARPNKRVKLSSIVPDLKMMCSAMKQKHPSH